jgi:orotidine-5'-phosphate decarboxylase
VTELHPARDHLVLALDVDSLDDALALVRRLGPWFGVGKVGLQLFSAAGPDAIAAVRDEGLDVFADLKLHDIPTTVGRAATVVGRTGARYLTTHAAGGVVMVRAAVEGFGHGAAMAGHPSPTTLAVTVLTSDPDSGPDVLAQRVAVAVAAGAPGLVCSAPDAERARSGFADATILCPGIRPAGSPADDQGEVAGPGEAAAAGADSSCSAGASPTRSPEATVAAAVADEVAALARLAPSLQPLPGGDAGGAGGAALGCSATPPTSPRTARSRALKKAVPGP